MKQYQLASPSSSMKSVRRRRVASTLAAISIRVFFFFLIPSEDRRRHLWHKKKKTVGDNRLPSCRATQTGWSITLLLWRTLLVFFTRWAGSTSRKRATSPLAFTDYADNILGFTLTKRSLIWCMIIPVIPVTPRRNMLLMASFRLFRSLFYVQVSQT